MWHAYTHTDTVCSPSQSLSLSLSLSLCLSPSFTPQLNHSVIRQDRLNSLSLSDRQVLCAATLNLCPQHGRWKSQSGGGGGGGGAHQNPYILSGSIQLPLHCIPSSVGQTQWKAYNKIMCKHRHWWEDTQNFSSIWTLWQNAICDQWAATLIMDQSCKRISIYFPCHYWTFLKKSKAEVIIWLLAFKNWTQDRLKMNAF